MRSVHPGEWTWKDANLDRLKFTRNYLWWYRQSREKKPRTGLFRLHTHVLIFHELYPRETWTLHACIAVRWVLINGWPRKKHVWIFICYIFVQVRNHGFWRSSSVGVPGYSSSLIWCVCAQYFHIQAQLADGIEKTGGSDDGKVRLESFNALQCIQLKIKSVEEKLKLDLSTR